MCHGGILSFVLWMCFLIPEELLRLSPADRVIVAGFLTPSFQKNRFRSQRLGSESVLPSLAA